MLLSNPYMVDPRVQAEAQALVEDGHDVSVLVWDREGLYPRRGNDGKVDIYRLWNKDILSIGNDTVRNPFWWRAALRWALDNDDFDVVHCHDLDTLPAGVQIKRKMGGVSIVFDAHEIFRYMVRKTSPWMVERFAGWLERRCLPYVDHLITVSTPFRNYYRQLYGGPISLVRNYKEPSKKYHPPSNDTFTLVYIGLMSKERFFPDILDMVEEMDDVSLILAGKKERMYHEIEEKQEQYDSVDFRGTIPSSEIYTLTRQADATFILVDPSYIHHRMTLFNKQFEAMAQGRPYIIPRGTYSGWLTERLNVGRTVPYTCDGIQNAIVYMRDNPDICREMGRRGWMQCRNGYNWDSEKNMLQEVYNDFES